MAVAGLLVGMSLHEVIPRKYTAQTTLLLVHNPNDDPTRDMATDVALLQSEAVAQRGRHRPRAQDDRPEAHGPVHRRCPDRRDPPDHVQRSDSLQRPSPAPTPWHAVPELQERVFQSQNNAVVQPLTTAAQADLRLAASETNPSDATERAANLNNASSCSRRSRATT